MFPHTKRSNAHSSGSNCPRQVASVSLLRFGAISGCGDVHWSPVVAAMVLPTLFAPSPFLALVLVTTARVVVGCTAKVPGDFKFVAVSIVCVVKCDAIVATVVDSDDAAVVTAFAVVTDGDIVVDFIVVVVGVATILVVLVVAFAIFVAVRVVEVVVVIAAVVVGVDVKVLVAVDTAVSVREVLGVDCAVKVTVVVRVKV